MLDAAGFDWLRLLDNGVVRAPEEQMPGLPTIHAYHLIPAEASKARAVARHMQARGYYFGLHRGRGLARRPRGELGCGGVLVGRERSHPRRSFGSEIAGRPGVRLASEPYGAGVYEAVVTTLAESGD